MACATEQALVASLKQQHAEAQQDCHDGIRSACARARTLSTKLTKAQTALQNCLAAQSPPPRVEFVRHFTDQFKHLFEVSGKGFSGSSQLTFILSGSDFNPRASVTIASGATNPDGSFALKKLQAGHEWDHGMLLIRDASSKMAGIFIPASGFTRDPF
jgi:hypothetical protein